MRGRDPCEGYAYLAGMRGLGDLTRLGGVCGLTIAFTSRLVGVVGRTSHAVVVWCCQGGTPGIPGGTRMSTFNTEKAVACMMAASLCALSICSYLTFFNIAGGMVECSVADFEDEAACRCTDLFDTTLLRGAGITEK